MRTDDPPSDSRPAATLTRRGLLATKLTLVAIFVGQIVAANRIGSWPMIGWTMYSGSAAEPPPTSVQRLEVRAVDAEGRECRLLADDLVPFAMIRVGNMVLDEAAAEPAAAAVGDPDSLDPSRQFIVNSVRRITGRAPRHVEIWRGEWDVRPYAVPPLEVGRPREMRRVAAFDVSPKAAAWQREEW